jgi:23S rRNA pseudouridine1911/1915/1917 synthase
VNEQRGAPPGTTPALIRVLAGEAGLRLDRLLAARLPALGRRGAQEAIARGQVTIGGRRVHKGDPARAGDEIALALAPERVEPEPRLPLDVGFECEAFVVARKPSGMPSAPLSTLERGSLAGALLARYPEMEGVGHRAREPGLVHRLDTYTSGLVLAARSQAAFESLWRALRQGDLQKRYLAVVERAGLPASGVVDYELAPDERDRARVRVVTGGPQPGYRHAAETRFRVIRQGERWALLELSVARAFRHQIRAHLAAIGHPIAGDRVYGGAAVERLGLRHALHASYMAWAGDGTLPGFEVEHPLPDELGELFET